MPPRVEYHHLADLEIIRAHLRYVRDGGATVGNDFLFAMDKAVGRVATMPKSCSPHFAGTRMARVGKFRHWVVFTEEPHRILIIAVMHSSRRPGYWRRRLPRP